MAERHPGLRYAEGYLVFPRPPGYEPHRLAHAWTETPGGDIIDPTAWAYAGLGPFRYERHRSHGHTAPHRPADPALRQHACPGPPGASWPRCACRAAASPPAHSRATPGTGPTSPITATAGREPSPSRAVPYGGQRDKSPARPASPRSPQHQPSPPLTVPFAHQWREWRTRMAQNDSGGWRVAPPARPRCQAYRASLSVTQLCAIR